MLDAAAARINLVHRAAELDVSLSELSRVAGKNPAYFQQYVERGTPKVLPEDVRLAVAIRLNTDERLLGARDPWVPMPPQQAANLPVDG
ncbi:MAG: hypothetical protein ACK4TC_04800 [Sphingomonas pseudosanguinis]|uniref:hypothetical protein n=1 Tax=Sphingomonas pseudosanguinis TaxID=413712 RepID=UPI00391AAFF5